MGGPHQPPLRCGRIGRPRRTWRSPTRSWPTAARVGGPVHRAGRPVRGVVLLLRVRAVPAAAAGGVQHQHADRRQHRLGQDQHRMAIAVRNIPFGRRIIVPGDPKDDWLRLSIAVGGQGIRLGRGLPCPAQPAGRGCPPDRQGRSRCGRRRCGTVDRNCSRAGRHRRPGHRAPETSRGRRARPGAGQRGRAARHAHAAAGRPPPRPPRPREGAPPPGIRRSRRGSGATGVRGAGVADLRAPGWVVRRAVHGPVRPGRADDRPGLRRARR